MRQVAVIGGGVAGMTAAVFAAESGAEVTIIEQKERVGKKILSTGNGRCNFTNRFQSRNATDLISRIFHGLSFRHLTKNR